ncbi:MAG: DUF4157 domain-containing protein [Actinomycetota bacterium]|nr:DUF4157 domain-containing protein [Actinomycetota bacterium]
MATRAALRASGARAATTGVTMHLPSPPDGSVRTRSLVAHELSHVRDSLRPRLVSRTHHTDTTASRAGHGPARRAESTPHFLLERLSGIADAGERRARETGSAVGSTAGGAGSSLADLAAAGFAQRTPPVGDLPVGGLAPLLSRATAVARETATEVAGQAAALPTRVEGAIGAAGERLPATAGDAGGIVEGAAESAETGGWAWQSTAGTAMSALPAEIAGAGHGPSAGGDGRGLSGRADELLEVLEDRLIAELERRGGRFAGVF